MDFPSFDEFAEQFNNEEKLAEYTRDIPHIIYMDDYEPATIEKFMYSLYGSAISYSFVHAMRMLNEYHDWLKKKLTEKEQLLSDDE